MEKTGQITNSTQVLVSDRIKFSHQNREYVGYVCKKGRKYAYIVCDDQSEFRVPYHRLAKIPGALKQRVQSQTEKLRVRFQVNDTVSFEFKGQMLFGTIIRFNPKRAHIVGDDQKEYQVPYALLTLRSTAHEKNDTVVNRDAKELEAVTKLAQDLLAQHQLSQWSFQFDHGTRRAGCCQYNQHVISLSYEYAQHASKQDIQETILHEIAHALVGKEHNHDAVWRAKAIEIGCSGNRCHDLQFTLPRYLVKCQNHCWVATAERQRRGSICTKCHGKVLYLTYTEDRWKQEQRQIAAKTHEPIL